MKRAFLLVLFCVVLLAGYTVTRTLLAKEKATLTFHSFDGGGPRYSVVFDSDIVSCRKEKRYNKPDHKRLKGAGYDVVFTFTGLKAGETVVTVQKRSPVKEALNEDRQYKLKVDNDLNVKIEAVNPASAVR